MDATSLTVGSAWIAIALLLLLLCRPLLEGRVKPNPWYGVRFRESFASEEAWLRINRYGGRRFQRWAWLLLATGVALLFVPMEDDLALTLACALGPTVCVLVPMIQAKRYARRLAGS